MQTTTEPRVGTTPTSPSVQGGTDGPYTDGTEIVAPGTACGAATGRTVVTVVSGKISCADALAVLDKYNALPKGDHGNANIQQFDGWSCSSPTYGTARELGYGQHCSKGDIELQVPFSGE